MDFSQTLAAYLSKVMEVTALIGVGDHSKIFDHIARQRVSYPLLVVDESGGEASEHLRGTTGFARGDYNIFAMGLTVQETTELWSAVRRNLETFGPGWMEETWVHGAHLVTSWRDRSFFEPDDKSQRIIYYSASLYSIWHNVPLEVV